MPGQIIQTVAVWSRGERDLEAASRGATTGGMGNGGGCAGDGEVSRIG